MAIAEAPTFKTHEEDEEYIVGLEPVGSGENLHHEKGEATLEQAIAIGTVVTEACDIEYDDNDNLMPGTAVIVF
jgi:hypothetical protein